MSDKLREHERPGNPAVEWPILKAYLRAAGPQRLTQSILGAA